MNLSACSRGKLGSFLGKLLHTSLSIWMLGVVYTPARAATVTVDQGPEVGLPEKINPGSTETIELVYDVPATVKPTGVEVHGSNTSAGVRVALPST